MLSSKKTRIFALITAVGFAVQLLAQEPKVNDFVELDQFLHGRDDGKFRKEDDNIKATLPPGTHGKIIETKHFSKTQYSPTEKGNWGVEIELTKPVNGRTKFWVYYTPDKPNMKFSATDTFSKPGDVSAEQAAQGTDKVDKAKSAIVTQATAGTSVADGDAHPDRNQEQAKAVAQEAIHALDRTNGQGKLPNAPCADCGVQTAGHDSNDDTIPSCPKVPDRTVGNYTIEHIEDGKACDVVVKPIDAMKKQLHGFSVSSDGRFSVSYQGNKQGFYFLPRTSESGADVVTADGKQQILLKTTGGQRVLVDATSGEINNMDGVLSAARIPPLPGQAQAAVKVGPNGQKDLYFIQPNAGHGVIDLGTHPGDAPERHSDGKATYYSDKPACDITMDNLFKYDYDKSSGQLTGVNFKFKNDPDLQSLLGSSKCKPEK